MISPTPSEIHLLFQTSRITGENYIKPNQGLIFYHVTQDFQRCWSLKNNWLKAGQINSQCKIKSIILCIHNRDQNKE